MLDLVEIWVLIGKKLFIDSANIPAMTIRNIKSKNLVAYALVAILPIAVILVGFDMNSNPEMTIAQAQQPIKPYIKVHANNAIYEPAVGKTNVFGPSGIFPFFNSTFSCANALSCGVQTQQASFNGVFKEGGGPDNQFTVWYIAPITYGDQQIKGHTYKVKLIDTVWNSTSAALPTRQAEFLSSKGNVAFNQMQHGHSMIDRSDAPMFFNQVALYGHVDVYDVTAGNKIVVHDIFTHVMVGKVVDESKAFTNLQLTPATQTVVAMFIVNIPSAVKLPGNVGPLTPDQAQSFTPLHDDPSLHTTPPVNITQLTGQGVSIGTPMPQSTTWPVDNPTQPVFFDFLLFTNVKTVDSEKGGMIHS